MALRDIFKFREPAETETSKPFLEHLEDLRWTIVKMALTLGVAMIVCFAFRSTLVRVIQAPLNHLGSQVGTLKALGITDSIVISFHLAFYAGIVLSFPLLLYFLAEFVLPARLSSPVRLRHSPVLTWHRSSRARDSLIGSNAKAKNSVCAWARSSTAHCVRFLPRSPTSIEMSQPYFQ